MHITPNISTFPQLEEGYLIESDTISPMSIFLPPINFLTF